MKKILLFTSFFFTFLIYSGNTYSATDTIVSQYDNTLFENEFGSLSNGNGKYFFAGTTLTDYIRRGLLSFNTAFEIPPGAVITNVKLVLNMSRTISGSKRVKLHKLTNYWGEGPSTASGEEGGGAASEAPDATWIHTFYDTQFWNTPGGDYDPTESASENVDGNGFYTWTSAGMIDDVQNWIDNPGSEFGWILIGDESETGTAKRFDTRENPLPSNRPKLIVTYTFNEIALRLQVLAEGLFEGSVQADTFRVNLRSAVSPYPVIDTDISYMSLESWFVFNTAASGNYYIEVNQRNSINTWSAFPQSFNTGLPFTNYQFTTALSKAYGNNQILKLGVPCMFSGDINKDNFINLTDVLSVYNGSNIFLTGYVAQDVTGNNIVDLTDLLITYNNSSAFVMEIKP